MPLIPLVPVSRTWLNIISDILQIVSLHFFSIVYFCYPDYVLWLLFWALQLKETFKTNILKKDLVCKGLIFPFSSLILLLTYGEWNFTKLLSNSFVSSYFWTKIIYYMIYLFWRVPCIHHNHEIIKHFESKLKFDNNFLDLHLETTLNFLVNVCT